MTLRIAFTFDMGSFATMQALLESEGITVVDLAMGGHVAIAGADQGYYLEVLPEQHDRARQILTDHELGKYLLDPASS